MTNYSPLSSLNPPDSTEAVIRARLVECRVCLGQHDDEIHAATLSVHRWFRGEVTKSFEMPVLV